MLISGLNNRARYRPLTDGIGAGYGYTLSLLPQADGFSSLATALDKAQSVGDITKIKAADRTAPIVGPLTVGLKVFSPTYTFDDLAMDVFLLNAVAALTVMQPEIAPFTAAFLLAATLPPSGSTQAEAQQLQFQTTGFVGGSGIGY